MNVHLAPTLGLAPPPPKNRGGRPAHRFPCGRHGRLTLKQAARIAGVSPEAIRQRIRMGWKGELLCSPVGPRPNHRQGQVRLPTMLIAARVALRCRGKVPSIEEIQAAHPMSRKAAERWRLMFRRALEAEGSETEC